VASNAASPFPAELLPALFEASSDLIHYRTLSNVSDQFELERASLGRARTEAESEIVQRLEQDRPRMLAAVTLTQLAATYTQSFDAGVRTMLEQPSLRDGTAGRFEELLNRQEVGYAMTTIEISERSSVELNSTCHLPDEESDSLPVSGGSISGCDLIALGAMLGGATCVMGCGECCVASAGGAPLYVAAR
jgi:hypothetical protein